jgi:CRISPR system Cascade subunit CasB
MSGLIAWLEQLNASDSKVRAILRHSLAFAPGHYIPAFPYVEPFLKDAQEHKSWQRDMHYLVAALWAAHWREGRMDAPQSLAKACAAHQLKSRSDSTERRFINLLDADREQLPHRLRQMVALLNDQSIDFQTLLIDLIHWDSESKSTQIRWARNFYRTLNPTSSLQPNIAMETNA